MFSWPHALKTAMNALEVGFKAAWCCGLHAGRSSSLSFQVEETPVQLGCRSLVTQAPWRFQVTRPKPHLSANLRHRDHNDCSYLHPGRISCLCSSLSFWSSETLVTVQSFPNFTPTKQSWYAHYDVPTIGSFSTTSEFPLSVISSLWSVS